MIVYETNPTVAELREAHRVLLVPTFRATELMPEDAFVAQFADRANAVLARDGDRRLLGIAVVEHFRDAVLLQYLAAALTSRGQGVGSGLLDAVLTRWEPAVSVILAEFDRPDVHPAHPAHGDPEARLRFYARYGALALELPYFQPALTADTRREYGMLLAAFDAGGALTRRGRLAAAQSAAVRNYLDDVLDGADDPDARRLREAADVRDGILVHPLAEYRDIPSSPLRDMDPA